MLEFICLFCPSFLSLIIHINSNKQNDYIKLISYYFLYVLCNSFIMIGILHFIFHRDILYFNLLFSTKYTILSTIVAVLLPYIIKKITPIAKKAFNIILNYLILIKNKVINNKLYKYIYNYYKNNKKEILYNIIFLVLLIIQFLLFDIIIRNVIFNKIAFYEVNRFTPNTLTIIYGLLIGIILLILPKLIRKIMFIIISLFNLILFIANYMLILIKGEPFSVYNLEIAEEGFAYLNFVLEKINISFVMIIIIFILLLIFSYKILNKTNCNIKCLGKIFIIVISVIFSLILKNVSINKLDDFLPHNGWTEKTYPRYFADNLINANKNVSVLGMYEYTFKDILKYIENMTTTYGSVEEIEKQIKNSPFKNEENEYTGIFKDKNLIMIMMESIDNVVVNEEVMPTLYKMKNEGWDFTKRYSSLSDGGSTIATEYSTITGLFYSYTNQYDLNTYNEAIPKVFSNNNYHVSSFHENNAMYYNRVELHNSYGFKNSYFLRDMNNINVETYQDAQFFENDDLYNLVVPKDIDNSFMSFIITISAHGPYQNNSICESNNINDESECLKYLSNRTDEMLRVMLEKLEEDGILEDTVIILYSDHAAYSYNYTEDELKETYKNIDGNYKIKNLPFIIYSTDIDSEKFDDIIVNDIDFAPTIYNLFGITYDARYYVGTDIFSNNHKNVCIFKDNSWYDGKTYSLNSDNSASYKEIYNYVEDRTNLSKMIISNNYYKSMKK